MRVYLRNTSDAVLNIFRKNHFLSSLLLLPYALLLRSPMLVGLVDLTTPPHPFTDFLSVSEWTPFWHWVFSGLLVYYQATIINKVVIRNRIIRDANLLPGMTFILLSSLYGETMVLSPTFIGITFLALATHFAFGIYNKYKVPVELFNTGLLIGIASLWQASFIFFVIFGIFAIVKLRALKLVETLQLITALVAVYFITWSSYYVWGDPSDFFKLVDLHRLNLNFSNIWSNVNPWHWIILILGILTALLSYNANMVKKSIQAQKKIDLLYWFLFISLPVSIWATDRTEALYLTAFLPIGIFLGMILQRTPNRPLAELIHFTLFAGSLANHYFQWW